MAIVVKIVIDDKIPYIRGAFEQVCDVVYLPGSQISAVDLMAADAIVTRTRTLCDEQLLGGSLVKFVASATIGYDHIDTHYCDSKGIGWTNAPGCNSKSVEQYIASVLMVLTETKKYSLNGLCIGVVGVGNVGSKVANICQLLGMKVLLNDPPRERSEGTSNFVSIEQIMCEADIITLHVPLNLIGDNATFHLGNEVFFKALKRKPILINTCRGEVIDTKAMKKALNSGHLSDFICDCWENEPNIDRELLNLSFLATPHIAGYSRDGKANGTVMSVRAISRFFQLGLDDWECSDIEMPLNPEILIDGMGLSEQEIIAKAILHSYDIRMDDLIFKQNPNSFENLRDYYPVRREFLAYTVKCLNIHQDTILKLNSLGFNTKISTEGVKY